MNGESVYDIEKLKYVGEKRAKLYHKLGINNIKDLLYHCPRIYIDLTQIIEIASAVLEQMVVIKVVVIFKHSPLRTQKKGLVAYKLIVADSTSSLTVTLFNEPYKFNSINVGQEYIVYGKITRKVYNNKIYLEMNSPMVIKACNSPPFIPVYRLTAGLTSKIISRNVYDALKIPNLVKEYLPSWILQKADLIDLNLALNLVHFPKSLDDINKAKKRIIFDELFIFSLGLILLKRDNLKKTSVVVKDKDLTDFLKNLPYELTSAQNKVVEEISDDMSKDVPMSRLLQGDVGSGKTVVAMSAIYLATKNGLQSAFMVPTEILARQHFELISNFMQNFGFTVGLLVGSMSVKQKNRIKDGLMVGAIDIVIGTHAIIQDDVVFKNLGLVITDEQHRFGVKQRAKLSQKGQEPHKLIMSATPIPRTLSMMMYGDLDVSIIDVMPSNRKQILTYLIDGKKRKRAYNFVKQLINQGRQAYIVCPLIENNEFVDARSVIDYGEYLKNEEFKDYNVEIIHGKTHPEQKDEVMQNFKDGKIDLLISTTVIEVGIDVPQAAVIVIEDAERYGLSQLHQLRGRVGRGEYQSYCILISDSKSLEAIQKLKMMTKTYDGFQIAEYDLKVRGPGDFFGDRQHGLPKFKNFDMLKDIKLLKLSQEIVMMILNDDINLSKDENQTLKIMVSKMINSVDC